MINGYPFRVGPFATTVAVNYPLFGFGRKFGRPATASVSCSTVSCSSLSSSTAGGSKPTAADCLLALVSLTRSSDSSLRSRYYFLSYLLMFKSIFAVLLFPAHRSLPCKTQVLLKHVIRTSRTFGLFAPRAGWQAGNSQSLSSKVQQVMELAEARRAWRLGLRMGVICR